MKNAVVQQQARQEFPSSPASILSPAPCSLSRPSLAPPSSAGALLRLVAVLGLALLARWLLPGGNGLSDFEWVRRRTAARMARVGWPGLL